MPTRKSNQTQDQFVPIITEHNLTELCHQTGILDFDAIAPNLLRASSLLKHAPHEGSLPADVITGIRDIIKATGPSKWKQYFRTILEASEDASQRIEVKFLLWRTFERVFPYTRDGVQCVSQYRRRALGSSDCEDQADESTADRAEMKRKRSRTK